MTIGVPLEFPSAEDIETMLWWQLIEWTVDMKPGKYEFMDITVKNYAFKLHNQFKSSVEFLKGYSSFLDEVRNDS